MLTACSLCGYIPPPPMSEDDETIRPSDVIDGAPMTCWLCDEIAEKSDELAVLRARRDSRARSHGKT
jgi:hypothetical protein